MNIRTLAVVSAFVMVLAAAGSQAEERMYVGAKQGKDLVAEGATDALTAPGQIVDGIAEETKEYGVFGIVGGPVRGSLRAGAQAARGGARMAVGILDVLTSPFRSEDPS